MLHPHPHPHPHHHLSVPLIFHHTYLEYSNPNESPYLSALGLKKLTVAAEKLTKVLKAFILNL